jgi:HK97 family phage portal protein
MAILDFFIKDKRLKQLESEIENLKKQLEDATFDDFIRQKEIDDFGAPTSNIFNYYSSIEQQLDTATLLKLLTTEGWFYIAVNAIAKTIASLPIKLYKQVYRDELNEQTGVVTRKLILEDASGEPESLIFQYPNDLITATEFYWLILSDLLATGDAFIYLDIGTGSINVSTRELKLKQLFKEKKIKSTDLKVQGIYRINPALIDITIDKETAMPNGYVIRNFNTQHYFSLDEIIHIKLPNPANHLRGLAPIVPVFKNVLLDRYSTEHMIRFYKQGARLGGVIETQQKLTKEQITRLQRAFEADYTGKRNHHRTLILPQGMTYKAIEENPYQESLINFIKNNREPIMSAYNVPPIKVGLLDGATYANALIQLKIFFTDTIMPIISILEGALNKSNILLPSEKNLVLKFDLSQIEALQENQEQKAETAIKLLQSGWTINEVRQRLWSLPNIENADTSPLINTATRQSGLDILTTQESESKTIETKLDAQAPQPDAQLIASDITDTKQTFEQRVATLIAQLMAQGVPLDLATRQAIEQALLEGYKPQTSNETTISEQAQNEQSNQIEIKVENESEQNDKTILETYDGSHFHKYQANATKTEIDGAHCHIFVLSDGTQITTELDGEHEHIIPEPSTNEKQETGAHYHIVRIGDKEYKTEIDGAHSHEYLVNATTLSGVHTHKLVLDDGTEIYSITQLESFITTAINEDDVNTQEQELEPKIDKHPFTQEQIDAHLKAMTGEGIKVYYEKRLELAKEFFNNLSKLVSEEWSDKFKQYGIYHITKAKNNVFDKKKLKTFIEQETEKLIEFFNATQEYGFNNTLIDFRFKFPNEKATELSREYAAEMVQNVTQTTIDQLNEIISSGMDQNLSVAEISKNIRDYFQGEEAITRARAETIARTETLTMISEGQNLKVKEFKKEYPKESKNLMKVWITAQDERVRGNPEGIYKHSKANHFDLDGEVVKETKPFSNGLMYPRQKGAPPEEVINCRCTYMIFFKEDKDDVLENLEPSEASDL